MLCKNFFDVPSTDVMTSFAPHFEILYTPLHTWYYFPQSWFLFGECGGSRQLYTALLVRKHKSLQTARGEWQPLEPLSGSYNQGDIFNNRNMIFALPLPYFPSLRKLQILHFSHALKSISRGGVKLKITIPDLNKKF